MELAIFRSNFKEQTLGNMFVINDTDIEFQCKTLELPDLNNQSKISCIPEGRYKVSKTISPSQGNCFAIHDTPGRDHILIHSANYKSQLLGCIAVGDSHIDINADGLKDVTNSKKVLTKLLSIMPDEFYLTIKNLK